MGSSSSSSSIASSGTGANSGFSVPEYTVETLALYEISNERISSTSIRGTTGRYFTPFSTSNSYELTGLASTYLRYNDSDRFGASLYSDFDERVITDVALTKIYMLIHLEGYGRSHLHEYVIAAFTDHGSRLKGIRNTRVTIHIVFRHRL